MLRFDSIVIFLDSTNFLFDPNKNLGNQVHVDTKSNVINYLP